MLRPELSPRATSAWLELSTAAVGESGAKAATGTACCGCASCASHAPLSGRLSTGTVGDHHTAWPPQRVPIGSGWQEHQWAEAWGGEAAGRHRGPSSAAARGQGYACGSGSCRASLAPRAGAGGSQAVSLRLCREARNLPTRQSGDPHARRLHEPVQDGLQLLREPEVLQERLWQGLLRDAPPLRSVRHPPTPGLPQHPQHSTHVPVPLMALCSLCRRSRLPPAWPQGSCCPTRVLHAQALAPHSPSQPGRAPSSEPSASASSPGSPTWGVPQPPALSPIKQPLPAALVATFPSRHAPGRAAALPTPSHILPTTAAAESWCQCWGCLEGLHPASASADWLRRVSKGPQPVPLPGAAPQPHSPGCPMALRPGLPWHAGSSTCAQTCSEQGHRSTAASMSHQSRAVLCSTMAGGRGDCQCVPLHKHHPNPLLPHVLPAQQWHVAHGRSPKDLWAVNPTCPCPMPAPAPSLPCLLRAGPHSRSCPTLPGTSCSPQGSWCPGPPAPTPLPAPRTRASSPTCLRGSGTPGFPPLAGDRAQLCPKAKSALHPAWHSRVPSSISPSPCSVGAGWSTLAQHHGSPQQLFPLHMCREATGDAPPAGLGGR